MTGRGKEVKDSSSTEMTQMTQMTQITGGVGESENLRSLVTQKGQK